MTTTSPDISPRASIEPWLGGVGDMRRLEVVADDRALALAAVQEAA